MDVFQLRLKYIEFNLYLGELIKIVHLTPKFPKLSCIIDRQKICIYQLLYAFSVVLVDAYGTEYVC